MTASSGIIAASMRDFLIVSFFLSMLPATAIATMQFLTAHRWLDAGLAVLGWLAFPLCYWWPLGAWLFRARRHWAFAAGPRLRHLAAALRPVPVPGVSRLRLPLRAEARGPLDGSPPGVALVLCVHRRVVAARAASGAAGVCDARHRCHRVRRRIGGAVRRIPLGRLVPPALVVRCTSTHRQRAHRRYRGGDDSRWQASTTC